LFIIITLNPQFQTILQERVSLADIFVT